MTPPPRALQRRSFADHLCEPRPRLTHGSCRSRHARRGQPLKHACGLMSHWHSASMQPGAGGVVPAQVGPSTHSPTHPPTRCRRCPHRLAPQLTPRASCGSRPAAGRGGRSLSGWSATAVRPHRSVSSGWQCPTRVGNSDGVDARRGERERERRRRCRQPKENACSKRCHAMFATPEFAASQSARTAY